MDLYYRQAALAMRHMYPQPLLLRKLSSEAVDRPSSPPEVDSTSSVKLTDFSNYKSYLSQLASRRQTEDSASSSSSVTASDDLVRSQV